MRHLANAGVPSENLHGIDIVNFWDLGLEMFNDRDKFNGQFTQADMLADSDAADGKLAGFAGKFDVISIFQVRFFSLPNNFRKEKRKGEETKSLHSTATRKRGRL